MFKIHKPETNLQMNKIKLFMRMQQNEYTDELIVECLENGELDGFVGEVKNLVGVNSNSLYEINEECERYKDSNETFNDESRYKILSGTFCEKFH